MSATRIDMRDRRGHYTTSGKRAFAGRSISRNFTCRALARRSDAGGGAAEPTLARAVRPPALAFEGDEHAARCRRGASGDEPGPLLRVAGVRQRTAIAVPAGFPGTVQAPPCAGASFDSRPSAPASGASVLRPAASAPRYTVCCACTSTSPPDKRTRARPSSPARRKRRWPSRMTPGTEPPRPSRAPRTRGSIPTQERRWCRAAGQSPSTASIAARRTRRPSAFPDRKRSSRCV